jgi:hypothetical protein
MLKTANRNKLLNKTSKELFIYVVILFILLLVSVNIDTYLKPVDMDVKVLGAETQNKEDVFWKDFLSRHPDYIPGWIEIERIDKANEIDPNYIIKP